MTVFLDLPLELRNMVYRELLSAKKPTVQPQKYAHKPKIGNKPLDPAILRTCRQVHEETMTILYEDNLFYYKFSFYHDYNGLISRAPDGLNDDAFKQVKHVTMKVPL